MRAASRNGGLVMQQDVLRALGEIAPTALELCKALQTLCACWFVASFGRSAHQWAVLRQQRQLRCSGE